MAARKNCVLATPIDMRAFAAPADAPAFERAASTPSTSDAELPGDAGFIEPEAFDDSHTREVCARELLNAQLNRSAQRRKASGSRNRSLRGKSPASPIRPWRRRPRAKDLFVFFVRWKRIEHLGGARPTADALLNEFCALNGPMQYYWTHMHELWCLYERQQLAICSPLRSTQQRRARTRELIHRFYHLGGPAQKLLVDDWIAECSARQRERHAEQLETCLARKTLVKIKADVLALVASIDYVLRESRPPRNWPATVAGI